MTRQVLYSGGSRFREQSGGPGRVAREGGKASIGCVLSVFLLWATEARPFLYNKSQGYLLANQHTEWLRHSHPDSMELNLLLESFTQAPQAADFRLRSRGRVQCN